MTRERISFTFDPRDMLLSLQMGFSFVRAAVACAILERTSGLEPSSETTAPRYLKLVTVPNFCPFTFISVWMPLALFVISLVFSALISILYFISHSSKVMLKVIMNRLKPQAEEIIAEEQAGFRAGRSTTEQIFNLRILCEKYLQHQQNLYHVFIDFQKALTEYGMQPYGPPCGSTISVQI